MELDKRFTACRLCLCSSEILIGIFDHHHGYIPAEIIVELLRFEVAKGDMFPQCVCGECVGKLIDFKKFQEICCIFKASLDRAYGAKFTKVPGKNLFLVGQSPVPCKIEKVRAVEEVGVRGPGIITQELGALNTDEEVIVPEDLTRIPFFPAKAEIDPEFEGNHQKNILVPIDLDQALCEDKSETGAFICPDISGVENTDQVKTESEADEKDPEAVDEGKEGKILETPSRSTCVAEKSGCQPSDGTEEKRSTRLRDQQLVQADRGKENDNIEETPSRSVRVAEESGCVAVNLSCHPSDGCEEPQGRLPRDAEAEQADGGMENDKIQETPSRSARVAAEKLASDGTEESRRALPKDPQIVQADGGMENDNIEETPSRSARVAAEKSGCHPSDGTEELRGALPRVVDGVKGNVEVQSLSKIPSLAEKSRSKNGENAMVSGKRKQRIIVVVGKRGNTDIHRPSKIVLRTKESRPKNAEDTEDAGKMVQKVVGAIGKKGNTVLSLPKKLFYQPKIGQSLLKSLLPAGKSILRKSKEMVEPEIKEQRVVEAEGMTQHTDVQDLPKSPLVAEKGRSENSGDKEDTQKMGHKVVEAEGMTRHTDVENIPKSQLVAEKDRSKNSGDKEDTQKIGRKVVEAEGMSRHTDVQDLSKSPLVAEKDRSKNSGDKEGTQKMGRKVVEAEVMAGKTDVQNIPKSLHVTEKDRSENSEDTQGAIKMDQKDVDYAQGKSGKIVERPVLVSDSALEAEGSNCERSAEEPSARATRSMVAPPKQKKQEEQPSPADSDDKVDDPTDDFGLEDSESDFQPGGVEDGSDSSGEEFVPQPPKRSKGISEGPANMKADVPLSSSSSHSKNYDDGGQRAKKKSSESLGKESLDCDCDACTGKLRKCHTPRRTSSFVNTDHDYTNKGAIASGKSQAMVGTVKRVVSGGVPGKNAAGKAMVGKGSTCIPQDPDAGISNEENSQNDSNSKDVSGNEDEDTTDFLSDLDSEDTDEEGGEDNDTILAAFKGEKGVYDCSLCGKRYFQWRTYRYHMDQHRFGNRFKCNECGKAFYRKEYLRTHMDVHQTERNFQCDVCGKAFKSFALLYRHKKTHGEKNYVCELCGKKFITVSRLNHHLECHNRDKIYPCEKCGKTFTTKFYVTQHVRTVHLKQTKYKYSCEVCGRKCGTPYALKSHRMIHSGERPFKCSVCDKAFRTKNFLEQHVNSHTKEKSYKCDVCDAVLSTVTSLARHKERHKGEMKYKCDNCGKQYTQSHNLKNHMKKCHTDSG
ncbi:uncharacterized protein LOC124155397 isoform X2 [Ischnura elegans]|uniref:uncharacterized protein LOC124155397 isoform X2 n=1 Tax=Ischnura elegans TaxID=197161 RepID=UPI001ED8A3B0|nr:uncharacterized protein LOC124155397 isoform X2 [Ischnura elegans]